MGKLNRLQIIGYDDGDFLKLSGKSFTVAMNPSGYSNHQGIKYYMDESLDGGNLPTFQSTTDDKFEFEFVLDATGVLYDWMDASTMKYLQPLSSQIKELKDTVYKYNGNAHEPYFIKIIWGALSYAGRLETLTVKNTLFNSEGEAIRATVKMSVLKYVALKTQNKENNKSSPDLTHLVMVKAGDTLPLLCWKIYKSAIYCADVARINNLTGFRDIEPGTQLYFPPLSNE